MNGMLVAWLVGESIVVYRAVSRRHRPPLPAELLGASGAFVLLALLHQWQPGLATTIAWGLDAAAFMSLYSGSNAPKAPAATTL